MKYYKESKFYIVKIHKAAEGCSEWREYKRFKRIDGFSANKEECWKFSKLGAVKIIERLKKEYADEYKSGTLDFETEEIREDFPKGVDLPDLQPVNVTDIIRKKRMNDENNF